MTDKIELTERESKVYKAIVEFIDENKYPPTVRELVTMTGINSTSEISNCINRLSQKGYITYRGRTARSISVNR